MALPQDVLSSEVIPSPFLGGRALPVSKTKDFETGGVALNDPSEGHQHQIWQAEIINRETIQVSAEEVEASTLYSGTDITEVSLSFDQNMRPVLAFVEGGVAKLRWFDSQASGQVVTSFGTSYLTPRVSLDDKRGTQMGNNDVIFAYLRGGNLYHRLQRDRYGVEYLLQSNVQSSGIIKMGMSRANRFQFLMGYS